MLAQRPKPEAAGVSFEPIRNHNCSGGCERRLTLETRDRMRAVIYSEHGGPDVLRFVCPNSVPQLRPYGADIPLSWCVNPEPTQLKPRQRVGTGASTAAFVSDISRLFALELGQRWLIWRRTVVGARPDLAQPSRSMHLAT